MAHIERNIAFVHIAHSRGVVTVVQVDIDVLKRFAGKYIWWKTPDEAVAMPERVIAQVMNIGDYADVQTLATLVGEDVLRTVLRIRVKISYSSFAV